MLVYKIVRLFEDGTEECERSYLKSNNLDVSIEVKPSYTEEEVINNAKDADFIIVGYENISKKVIESLPKVKMVVFRSIGFNGIDLDYANKTHLPVAHISRYCTQEVADYVVAAILVHNRRLIDFNNSVKNDKKWDYNLFPDMRRLSALTVGLIGMGNIPKLVSKRLLPFGCKIIAYDPYLPQSVFDQYHVESVSLAEIFEKADYISSHLPLNPETEKLIDQKYFNMTSKAPVFINSSRGGVVNEEDLIVALKTGKLSYAILDVLSTETPDLSNLEFIKMDNVVLTPHIAFYSQEAFSQSAIESLENIKNFIAGNYAEVQLVNRSSLNLH